MPLLTLRLFMRFLDKYVDYNSTAILFEAQLAVTYIDEKHQRVSSESAYLTPDVLARKNLTVAINATVTRIIFEQDNGETRAVGVEFSKTRDGQKYCAKANRDIVLWRVRSVPL